MTVPPPLPPSSNPPTSRSHPSNTRSNAWGSTNLSQPRRELSPVQTSFKTSLTKLGSATQQAPSRNPWSPAATISQGQSVNLANRQSTQSPSATSASSRLSPPPGLQQGSSASLLGGGRSRTIGSSGGLQSGSGGGGSTSGGGGSTKSYRGSPSLPQPSYPSPTSTATPGSQSSSQTGSLSKIVIAQLFLLLSTIKDDKDKSKWDAEAEKIRKLVDSNGMEVFTKYFRRLIVSNSSQIWGPNRSSDVSGNYPILVAEIQKVTDDPLQAAKIVESIETGDGETFKDFDLSTFMEHFKMDSLQKITLASAFKKSSKSDLRTKADAIISNNIQNFLAAVESVTSEADLQKNEIFATVIDRLAQAPPRNWSGEVQQALQLAFYNRFNALGLPVPAEISSTFHLFELVSNSNPFVRLVQAAGPKATESHSAAKAMLEKVDMRDINYEQVACVILFMSIARDEPAYNVKNFVAALREHRGGQRLDWQDVIRSFDRDSLRITNHQFKRIYDALLPIAHDQEKFDLQLLWGGSWRYEATQLAFVAAFLSFTDEEIDASQIPRLRPAFSLEDVKNAPDAVKSYAEVVVRHPFVSLDAIRTLHNLVFHDNSTYENAKSEGVIDRIVNANISLYVASASAVPKPWNPMQKLAIQTLVEKILERTSGDVSEHNFALYLLWQRDQIWIEQRVHKFYERLPIRLDTIMTISRALGWFDRLIFCNQPITLDLATLAHGRDLFDLEAFLQRIILELNRTLVLSALCKLLNEKIDDEMAVSKAGQPPSQTPLTIKTAYCLLTFLGDQQLPEHERVALQRAAVSAYPRLINYGEGFDEIIDENGSHGNGLSPQADAQMQDHFRMMWNGEQKVKDIVNVLQRCKTSQDPTEQDLFACMIWGLFDEYNCFAQYPMNALADTAVLFGGIINYRLLSKIALQVAISMVLEAVREHQPAELMFKFGLQALLHFQDRLEEWELLNRALMDVDSLRGTEIYPKLEAIARERHDSESESRTTGGPSGDDFLAPKANATDFACLNIDFPESEQVREPDESLQENVLFALNNVSEHNLEEKAAELAAKIRPEHHAWFAHYLVEGRIKSQPNFHGLYMDLLDYFDDANIWEEVLRETLTSAIRMLNSESTMGSVSERTLLKNLAVWLGSMTLARNQAIRYRNISFRDLLIEGSDTDRLIVVIPFTCKVLVAAADSVVFRPPCSWTMEILSVLAELCEIKELRANAKFEIEILLKAFDLRLKDVTPSELVRSRQHLSEVQMPTPTISHLEGFNDLGLVNLNRSRGMAERFSSATIGPQLPEIASVLRHNYAVASMDPAAQDNIKRLLIDATERAVSEIIGAVVERSVTIAGIAASQLVQKDFALERDIDKLRESAHIAAQSLSGSLAAVTCKEPLRNTMFSNITQARMEIPDHIFPGGSIHMFVNDNIETVCNLVEKAAANASTDEIDIHLTEAMQKRRGSDFGESQLSPWANYIPDPYKITSAGLNADQLAIYEDFARTARGPISQANNLSLENGRQVPDILQDQLQPAFQPADTSMSAMSSSQMQHHSQTVVNGFPNGTSPEEHVPILVDDIFNSAREATSRNPQHKISDDQAVNLAWQRLRQQILQAPLVKDSVALTAAKELAQLIYADHYPPPVLDLLVQVLRQVCLLSDSTEEFIVTWCSDKLMERIFDTTPVTAALVRARLIDISGLDLRLADQIDKGRPAVLQFLSDFIDETLLTDPPFVLRADLSNALAMVSLQIASNRGTSICHNIIRKLGPPGSHPATLGDGETYDDQPDYIFEEWLRHYTNCSPFPVLARFAQQLHTHQLLDSPAGLAIFLKASVAKCIEDYDPERADSHVPRADALAKLIVFLVNCQAKSNGAVSANKLVFLETVLTLLVLIFGPQSQTVNAFAVQKTFFRLFGTLIGELRQLGSLGPDQLAHDPLLAVARNLPRLQPSLCPGLAFAWLSLISNRALMPALILRLGTVGRKLYCELLGIQLTYVGHLLDHFGVEGAAKDFFRGTLKLLLILHHDFPDFLAEHSFQLLRTVPQPCTQVRSLIISAAPSSVHDQPDPFTDGLDVERLEDAMQSPIIAGDFEQLLADSGLLPHIDKCLSEGPSDEHVNEIIGATTATALNAKEGVASSAVNMDLLHALLIYVVRDNESRHEQGKVRFSPDSNASRLLDEMTERFEPASRYLWLSAIANNLRYANSHSLYYCYTMLHLFRGGQTDRVSLDIQQQIVRVLTERIVVHRPHPWGLIVTLVDLVKNSSYHLFDAPFVKAAPEIQQILESLLNRMARPPRLA